MMQAAADDDAPDVLVVTGPTASGKSALALALAERHSGSIVNMDAMQCYAGLRVLTARPTEAEEARVPHLLYGVRDAAEPATAGWWRAAALDAIGAVRASGRLPILCGGTGMYLKALAEGIAATPPVPAPMRAEARARLAAEGPEAAHAWLAARDPATAASIRASDPQRIARAIEVFLATGRGLAAWQQEALPPAKLRFSAILVDPPPAELRAAIATRFEAMLRDGALAEVRALVARGLDPALPVMRAHGVPELAAHLRGEMTLEAAAARAVLLTGQYTKRQRTWWRHHEPAPPARTHNIHARIAGFSQLPERETRRIFAFLDDCGLTAMQPHP